MPRIVIPDDEPAVMTTSAAFQKLADHDVYVYSRRPMTPADLIARIQDADAVINIRATSRFNRDVLSRATRLRMISIWGTGTDHVDLVAAQEYGILVTNTPGVSAIAVAEHTLSLIMAAVKQTVTVDRQVRGGKWP